MANNFTNSTIPSVEPEDDDSWPSRQCRLIPPCQGGGHYSERTSSHWQPANALGKYHITEDGLLVDLNALKRGNIYRRSDFLVRARAWFKAEVDRLAHLELVLSEKAGDETIFDELYVEEGASQTEHLQGSSQNVVYLAKAAQIKRTKTKDDGEYEPEEGEDGSQPVKKRRKGISKEMPPTPPTRVQPPRASKRKVLELFSTQPKPKKTKTATAKAPKAKPEPPNTITEKEVEGEPGSVSQEEGVSVGTPWDELGPEDIKQQPEDVKQGAAPESAPEQPTVEPPDPNAIDITIDHPQPPTIREPIPPSPVDQAIADISSLVAEVQAAAAATQAGQALLELASSPRPPSSTASTPLPDHTTPPPEVPSSSTPPPEVPSSSTPPFPRSGSLSPPMPNPYSRSPTPPSRPRSPTPLPFPRVTIHSPPRSPSPPNPFARPATPPPNPSSHPPPQADNPPAIPTEPKPKPAPSLSPVPVSASPSTSHPESDPETKGDYQLTWGEWKAYKLRCAKGTTTPAGTTQGWPARDPEPGDFVDRLDEKIIFAAMLLRLRVEDNQQKGEARNGEEGEETAKCALGDGYVIEKRFTPAAGQSPPMKPSPLGMVPPTGMGVLMRRSEERSRERSQESARRLVEESADSEKGEDGAREMHKYNAGTPEEFEMDIYGDSGDDNVSFHALGKKLQVHGDDEGYEEGDSQDVQVEGSGSSEAQVEESTEDRERREQDEVYERELFGYEDGDQGTWTPVNDGENDTVSPVPPPPGDQEPEPTQLSFPDLANATQEPPPSPPLLPVEKGPSPVPPLDLPTAGEATPSSLNDGTSSAPEAAMEISPTLGKWSSGALNGDPLSEIIELAGLKFAVDICGNKDGTREDLIIML